MLTHTQNTYVTVTRRVRSILVWKNPMFSIKSIFDTLFMDFKGFLEFRGEIEFVKNYFIRTIIIFYDF